MSKDSLAQPADVLRPRHVGAPIKRTEDPRLLTGNGEYAADRKPDRALHVAFRRSEQPHARIVRIDTSAVQTAPGVVAVFTAEDIAGDFKPVIPVSRMANYYATPILPLACGKVRYVGEAIVAVVATSRYLAEDALELIEIEFEPLGALSRSEQAVAQDAPLLHEEAGTNVLIAREFKKGDVEADLKNAAVRVGGRFEMTRKAPLAMEPRSYTAEYDAKRGAITLYTSSNIPGIVRDAISESLGLPGSRLRVVAPDVGGSFGSKGSLYPEELLICIAARKLGRSLKWTADRLEDISSSSQAFAEIVDAEMGFDNDGVAVALQADVLGDVGAYSIYPWTCGLEPVQVVSFLPGPYKIRSYRGAVRGVATCKPPTGPYRGVGRPISTFVTERLMDLGAKALGLDPLEIRRRNLVRAEEFPYRIASGIICGQDRLYRMPRCGRCSLRLRTTPHPAGRGAQGREVIRDRHRELRRTDRHRVAHCGRPGHADQHRFGNGKNLHQFDRRHHRGLRGCVPRPRVRDHAGADHRRRSRRKL